jgi:hypothetical protein
MRKLYLDPNERKRYNQKKEWMKNYVNSLILFWRN